MVASDALVLLVLNTLALQSSTRNMQLIELRPITAAANGVPNRT